MSLVKFLDYRKLWDYPGVEDAMKECMVTGKLILQEDVEEFEKNFADYLGVKHVIAVNSGTDALMLALIAAGVGPGDEVITVSHTFVATIQVIHHLGATPVLVDVADDGLMDWDEVYKNVNSKTKAIIPVHLSGDYSYSEFFEELKKTNFSHVKIIEDAAQAIGAKGVGFGDAQCYSFYPAKVLGTLGDAGAVATNNDEWAERIHHLRNHGSISKEPLMKYEFGWNSRMDNIWAAVLNCKLPYLEQDLLKRRIIAEKYDEELADLPLKLPTKRPGRIYQDYIIETPRRDELNKFLNDHGIETLITDAPNHLYPGLGLNKSLPVTERITRESIRIPCNQFMAFEDVNKVVEVIKDFYEM